VVKGTAVNHLLNNKFIVGNKLYNMNHRHLNTVRVDTGQHTEQLVLPKVDVRTTDENVQT